jgi:hypothetical protein
MSRLLRIIVLFFLIGSIALSGFAKPAMHLCKLTHTLGTRAEVHNYALQEGLKSLPYHNEHSSDKKCCISSAGYCLLGITAFPSTSFLPDSSPSVAIPFTSAHFYRIALERLERPPIEPFI